MSSDELMHMMNEWRHWALTADKSEDGWEADFPHWEALIDAALRLMTRGVPEQCDLDLLSECWANAEEGEELLERTTAHIRECWPALQALAESKSPACRWQVYEAAAVMGETAEPLLREGMRDPDAYARRRAALALARLRPHDAQALAEAMMIDPDPYMRQASVPMILAADDGAFRRRAFHDLAHDPIEQVRKAAQPYQSQANQDK